jgi:aspartate kinase
VNGILTADPNLDPQAIPLRELSYGEAGLLAAYGADVLHPKTIQPLVEKGIPLRLLNSFAPYDEGTRIVRTPRLGRALPPAIISMDGLSLLTLDGGDSREPLAWSVDILRTLHAAGLEAPMFTRSFADHRLNLFIRRTDQDHCLQILAQHLDGGFQLDVLENVAMISIVGFQPSTDDTIVRPGLSALSRSGARLIALAQAGHGQAISVCIPQDQLGSTVRHLHRELRAGIHHVPVEMLH